MIPKLHHKSAEIKILLRMKIISTRKPRRTDKVCRLSMFLVSTH